MKTAIIMFLCSIGLSASAFATCMTGSVCTSAASNGSCLQSSTEMVCGAKCTQTQECIAYSGNEDCLFMNTISDCKAPSTEDNSVTGTRCVERWGNGTCSQYESYTVTGKFCRVQTVCLENWGNDTCKVSEQKAECRETRFKTVKP